MAMYRYEAVAATGKLVTGSREAGSQDELVAWLHRTGHVPIRADATGRSGSLRALSLAGFRFRPNSGRKLALLTQQLATLLDAGLSLDRVLDIAQGTAVDPGDRGSMRKLADRVRGGSSLANALAEQNGRFPGYYVGMVRAGEAGATLDTTFRQLAELLEKSEASREQVKSAMIYPAVVLATGLASVFVLLGFVIPRFRPIFAEAGAALPSSARNMMALADLVQNDWPVLLAAAVAAVLALVSSYRNPRGRRRWDRIFLHFPLVGDLVTKVDIARFGRTLGTLLKNGVAPVAALSIARDTIANTAIAAALAPLGNSLKEGKGLSRPLTDCGVVPPLALHLVRVGEETARLEDMLLKVADIFDAEAKRAVERLIALLVPGITVLLGILVALIMGSLLKAMMSVYDVAV